MNQNNCKTFCNWNYSTVGRNPKKTKMPSDAAPCLFLATTKDQVGGGHIAMLCFSSDLLSRQVLPKEIMVTTTKMSMMTMKMDETLSSDKKSSRLKKWKLSKKRSDISIACDVLPVAMFYIYNMQSGVNQRPTIAMVTTPHPSFLRSSPLVAPNALKGQHTGGPNPNTPITCFGLLGMCGQKIYLIMNPVQIRFDHSLFKMKTHNATFLLHI